MISHDIKCPCCPACFRVETMHAEQPIALPCQGCWRAMGPAEKAPWLQVMRESPPLRRSLTHRDTTVYAPQTLQAYIHHLERIVWEHGLRARVEG